MKKQLSLILMLLAILCFSCGGGSQKNDTTSSDNKQSENSSSDEDAKSNEKIQASEDENSNTTTSKGGTAMPYKDLQKYLPKSFKGYELQDEMRGQSMDMQGMSISNAEATYKKGEENLNITLVDYHAAAPIYQSLTMAWNMGISVDNDQEKMSTTTLKGIKGFQKIDKQDSSTELVLGINDRFLLTIKASNQKNFDFVRAVAESMDLNGLKKLK